MSVRFKFRSSRNYDSVDIGGQPSISVGDLKSSIVQNKKLNLCQDFDLLFSDPISGQEYVDEDFQIPCGSSVIIKRVPAGARFGLCKIFTATDANMSKTSYLENVETVNFDDFGAELCPIPEGNLSGIGLDIDNKFCIGDEETHIELKSCSEQPVVECHKFEVSDISEALPQGQIVPETKSKADVELNIEVSAFPAMQTADFPSELKCSLCDTFFKEAVMIPCCQHSFCKKCIHHALVEKARCPKCISTKCKVEDLLPNLSLRQATERFLKSQILVNDSESDLHRSAPDRQSGIQVKDVSCAVSVLQGGAELPLSPFATRRGSDQVHAEMIGGMGSHLNPMSRRKGPCGLTLQGDRACYLCGSPGHLRRDCPAVSSPHPMLQRGAMPGYVSPYWNGLPFPPIRPFANPYGLPGMMPFNTAVIPAAPFPVPTYMPSMYGGSPAFGELVYGEDDVKRHQYDEAKRSHDKKTYPDRARSASSSEDSLNKKSLMKHRHSHTTDDDVYSDDERHESCSQVTGQNPKPYHHSERSRSEIDDMTSSSSWHSGERHKHGHRSSKKHNDRREGSDRDSSWTYYPTNKEKDSKRKIVKHDAKKHLQKHYNHSESSLEPNHSTDQRKKREKYSSRSSSHSGHKVKPARDELTHDRWQMASRSDEEDNKANYHYRKRKRVY